MREEEKHKPGQRVKARRAAVTHINAISKTSGRAGMEVLYTGLKQAASKLNVAAFTVRGKTKIKRSGQH